MGATLTLPASRAQREVWTKASDLGLDTWCPVSGDHDRKGNAEPGGAVFRLLSVRCLSGL